MRIIYNKKSLDSYFKDETLIPNRAILIDKFLNDAKEVDVDAISDGNDVFVCGILEHIEEAGIHSGDSACSLVRRLIRRIYEAGFPFIPARHLAQLIRR